MTPHPTAARIALLSAACTVSACVDVPTRIAADATRARIDFETRVGATTSPDGTEAGTRAALRSMLDGALTEDDAVRIALLNNGDVKAAYETLGIATADLVQAGLLSNPVFDGDAIFFFDGGTELELGLVQPFVDLFHRPLRQRLAEHELDAAIAAVTHELVHLAFSVRRAFVAVRAAQQLVELQTEVLAAAGASHDLMRALHDAGNVTAGDLAAERAAEARARLDLAAAEQAVREAREPLTAMMGLWGDDVGWRIEGPLPATVTDGVDLGRIESRAVAASLDLLENRALVAARAQAAGLQSWEGWFPGVDAGVGARREPGDDWGLGPRVAIELPVFDRGAPRLAAAEARVQHLLHRRVQLAVEVRSAARLLRERFTLLADRLGFVRGELVPARSLVLDETVRNYNAMQIGAFEVLLRRQELSAAAREELSLLRDAWLARLDLEELLAGSLPESIESTTWPEFRDDAGLGRDDGGGH